MHGNICTEAKGNAMSVLSPSYPPHPNAPWLLQLHPRNRSEWSPGGCKLSFFYCWTSLKARWRVPWGALQSLLRHMFREYETGSAVREHLKTAGKWQVIPARASGAIMRTPFKRALKPLRMLFHAFALPVTDADTGHLMILLAAGHISNHAWS